MRRFVIDVREAWPSTSPAWLTYEIALTQELIRQGVKLLPKKNKFDPREPPELEPPWSCWRDIMGELIVIEQGE